MSMAKAAAALLEPVPANRLFGLRVRAADPTGASVELAVRPEFVNVIGSLHASGLVALVDATGLAAIIGAAHEPSELQDLGALGASAGMVFHAPARGLLTGRCSLDGEAKTLLGEFYARGTDRVSIRTAVAVADDEGRDVCTGHFDWRIRRRPT